MTHETICYLALFRKKSKEKANRELESCTSLDGERGEKRVGSAFTLGEGAQQWLKGYQMPGEGEKVYVAPRGSGEKTIVELKCL